MNKEEITEALKKIEKEVSDTDFWLAYCKSVVDLLDENKHLKEENKILEDTIIRASDYIEHERFKRKVFVGLSERKYMKNIFDNLLEILKGDSNE